MGLVAKASSESNIKPLEAGTYVAVCSGIIDLGLQHNDKFNTDTHKILIMWDIPEETIEVDGEKQPRRISKEYTLSIGKKSNLRKDLEAWRSKPFTDKEMAGFDLKKILNTGCQLSIVQQERNGKTFSNVSSVIGLPKGMRIPAVTEPIVFDFDTATEKDINALPEWIQKKIRNSITYKDKFGVPEGFSEVTDEDAPPPLNDSDLPF